MSWHCLQEPAEEFSVESYLDGIASERWRLSDTRVESCSPANVTDSCQSSPSGMTCGPLTGNPGADLSMSSAAASPAKTYPARERESESTASAADSGQKCTESFARFDHASHSWKTPQCSLLAGLDEFSETWPKSGMMHAGRAYPLPTAARPTAGKESGYLHMMPTPTACNAPNTGSNTSGPKSLLDVARSGWNPGQQWPTPQATDYKRMKYTPETLAKRKNHQQGLPEMVYSLEFKMFPTPACQDAPKTWRTPVMADHKAVWQSRETILARPGKNMQIQLNQQVMLYKDKDGNRPNGGALNPMWVEWLMGWPIGWTDLKQLGTDKYRLWRRQHSEFCTGS